MKCPVTPIRVSTVNVNSRRLRPGAPPRRHGPPSRHTAITIGGSAGPCQHRDGRRAGPRRAVTSTHRQPPAPQFAHRRRQRIANDEREGSIPTYTAVVPRGLHVSRGNQPGADGRDHRPTTNPWVRRAQHPATGPARRSSVPEPKSVCDTVQTHQRDQQPWWRRGHQRGEPHPAERVVRAQRRARNLPAVFPPTPR